LIIKELGSAFVRETKGAGAMTIVNPTVLLISDRSDQSRDLANWLGRICACRGIGLNDQPHRATDVAVIVTDVGFRDPAHVGRLRSLLAQCRGAATPVAAVLRDDNRHEQVQAVALGATRVLPSTASSTEICRAVAAALESAVPSIPAMAALASAEQVEQAGQGFQDIFSAATHGGAFSRAKVDNATDLVLETIADGGIRRWLEIVWTYDNTTYQHCMLVTGLAAEFARSLGLSAKDQERLTRGALLHDLGKAKIPLAILNKPGRLDPEELAVMRTHPGIGYEILREQGDYEPEMLDVVLHHHELLDGSGYPDGLSGSQIGDLVRLITICDIYAALIERRPYKQPMQSSRAFEILQDMGGKLEAALLRAFTRVAESSAAAAAA
jgi:putative nucleotidyltransferase with HDIG domain